MGNRMGLEEYAALYGNQEQPAGERATMEAIAADRERAAGKMEQAAALKESVAQQIRKGNPPQYILYSALKCIGLLTHDEAWADDLEAQLDSVYGDLAQQSLLEDSAAIEGQRLEAQAAAYSERLRQQLQRLISGYGRVYGELKSALDALNEIDQAK